MTLKLRPTGLGSGSTRTALITPSAAVLQAKTLGSPHAYPTASSQGMTAPRGGLGSRMSRGLSHSEPTIALRIDVCRRRLDPRPPG